MPPRSFRPPKYRLHKPTGQALVVIKGRPIYLGKYGTPKSKEKYGRIVAELAVNPIVPVRDSTSRPGEGLLVIQLAAAYLKYAEGYYQKDGKPTGSMDRVKATLRVLRQLFAHLPVVEFGPLRLQAVQKHLVGEGHSRRYINHITQAIRRVFKWGVSQELLPVSTFEALKTVAGLKKGRTEAREPRRIKPVSDLVFQATLPWLPRVVSDMARLQRLTGSRPGEICLLRPVDVDRSDSVWIYRPATHKTDYREDGNRERLIMIGPRGQEVLAPYLLRPAESYCFSPRESVEEFHADRRENRKSPMTPSQRVRRRKRQPARAPADRYTTHSYGQAVTRGVRRANRTAAEQAKKEGRQSPNPLPEWRVNQLRHSAGTEIRKRFGIEASQTILGHANMTTTEIYAEKDLQRAATIMAEIG